jgi:hypothetical protein
MSQSWKVWLSLAVVMVTLAAAPVVEAVLVAFDCESGSQRIEGQNFCYDCEYTICCALFDDGSTQCVTNYHCLECEPRVK